MKKTIPALTALLISTSLISTSLYASTADDAEGNWHRTFKLSNGATITHTPSSVSLNLGGVNMQAGKAYNFTKTSSINGIKPSADGSLATAMTLSEFRQEVQKYGVITSEK